MGKNGLNAINDNDGTAISRDQDASPWASDSLDRLRNAASLERYLEKRYCDCKQNSFTMCVNGDWGTGKSFFIRGLKYNISKNHPVVFFNAWENDFSDDPLFGIAAEIKEQLSQQLGGVSTAKMADGIIECSARVLKIVAKIAVNAAVKKITGEAFGAIASEFGEVGKNASEGLEEAQGERFDDALEKYGEEIEREHNNKKMLINELKKTLADLSRQVSNIQVQGVQGPLYIFIDELDRCRPTYSIALLESIKHIYGIDGVYFVIGVNLKQLSHSVCAIYGATFDAKLYLKRFYDFEYTLPAPSKNQFTEDLFRRHDIDIYIEKLWLFDLDYRDVISCFDSICKSFGLTLRCQESIAEMLRAFLIERSGDLAIHVLWAVFLICTKYKSLENFVALSTTPGVLLDRAFADIAYKDIHEIATVGIGPMSARPLSGSITLRIATAANAYHWVTKHGVNSMRDMVEVVKQNMPQNGAQSPELVRNALYILASRAPEESPNNAAKEITSYFDTVLAIGEIT